MANILYIDESAVVHLPAALRQVPFHLHATYCDQRYDFTALGGSHTKQSPILILHFARERYEAHGLNRILLMTDARNIFRAAGLVAERGENGRPVFYRMGDDLDIRLTDNARRRISTFDKH